MSAPWSFTSTYVTIPRENVDTDQIIPARFLTTTDRVGLGPKAFFDWRYQPDGSPNPDFVLNTDAARGAAVLVAGHNFGCGSSREHAVWALAGAGFRVVISSGFADIFRGNALGNGLLPIEVDSAVLSRLLMEPRETRKVSVNLEAGTLEIPNGLTVMFAVPAFSRYCLLNDTNEMQFLLESASDIAEYERTYAATIDTRSGRHE
jgi:3-isopropylmalate/(R)-2-methylmalate dehydratase small subunit